MTEDLYERAVELLAKVADEFERLAGLELPVKLPDEVHKAWIDSQAYRDALAQLFDKDNTDGRRAQMQPVREAFVPMFRRWRDAAEPFEEAELTINLYEQQEGEYTAGEEPWPSNELIQAIGQLEEEVRRDRLLSS